MKVTTTTNTDGVITISAYIAMMDIGAGLVQSARIAREEGFPNVAQRCEEYARTLDQMRQMWSALKTDDNMVHMVINLD